MMFFIALLFACNTEACQFFQSDIKYFKADDCRQAIEEAVTELKTQVPLVHGVCVKVNTKDLL